MSTSPIRPTSDVFDESVLKVEFLPLPAQIPDFSLNLNTESLYYRLQTLMSEVFGPVRVQGLGVQYTGGNVVVATGLILHKNYLVRVLAPQSFALVDSPSVVYATITEQLLTSESAPEIVNVNPPLTRVSLPGPNQYRYSIQISYGANVPDDSAGVVHFKICNVSDVGVISNQLPLYTKKLGGFDFFTMETEQADHAMRIATLEASLNQMSAIQLDEAVSSGDWIKMVENSGPKARKVVCSMFPNTLAYGFTPTQYSPIPMTIKLSATTVAVVYADANDVYLSIGTNNSGTMSYSGIVCLGFVADSMWIGALDSTHLAVVYTVDETAYTKVLTINGGGASVTQSGIQTVGANGGYNFVTGAVLDSTHYVPIVSVYIGNQKIRGVVATFAAGAVSLGTPADRLTTQGSAPLFRNSAGFALDSSTIFVAYADNSVYGLAGTISGGVITWGAPSVNATFDDGIMYRVSAARLSSTKVLVARANSDGSNVTCAAAAISGTTVTWKTASIWSSTNNNSNLRIAVVGLDATHAVVSAYDTASSPAIRGRVVTLDGGDNLSFGAALTITSEGSNAPWDQHSCGLDSATVLFTFYDGTTVNGQLVSVSGTSLTLGNASVVSHKIPATTGYAALDSTKVVVVHLVGSTMIYCRVLGLNGSALEMKAISSFSVTGGRTVSVAALSATSFVVLYSFGNISLKCRVATVSGSVITMGAETAVNTGDSDSTGYPPIYVAALTSSKFVAVYAGSDGNLTMMSRAATVSGTTPTFGTEITIRTWDGITEHFRGASRVVALDASFVNVLYGVNDGSNKTWLEGVGLLVSGNTVSVSASVTPFTASSPDGWYASPSIAAVKVGAFIVASYVSIVATGEYESVFVSLKIGSNGHLAPTSVDRIRTIGEKPGLVALGDGRFGRVFSTVLGQAYAMYRLTEGGTMIAESAPSIFASGTSDTHERAVGTSPSFAVLPISEAKATYLIDDRAEAFGVMQEAGVQNEWKTAAVLGDISTVHSSLVGGVRYGLDTSLALVADVSPFVGIAVASTKLKLKGLA